MIKLVLILISLVSCSHFLKLDQYDLDITPHHFGLSFTETTVVTKDRELLKGWLIESPQRANTLIVQFHDQNDNRSAHFLSLAWATQYQMDLFIFDYRGTGDSTGSDDRDGLYIDTKSVLSYIPKHYAGRYQKVILVGQGLGGHLLLKELPGHPDESFYSMLVLDSAFDSEWDLLKSKFISYSWAAPSQSPISLKVKDVLVIHGKDDSTVPFPIGESIYNRIQASQKNFWAIAEGKHLDAFFSHDKIYREKFLAIFNLKVDYPISIVASENLLPLEKEAIHQLQLSSEEMKAKAHEIADRIEAEIKHQKTAYFPIDCERSCSCDFFAEFFYELGNKKLAQSMYRQWPVKRDEYLLECKEKHFSKRALLETK